jgi:hypothetical protein
VSEPFPDVVQDLWQLSHLTASYIGRAGAGAILLATGIIDNSAIASWVGLGNRIADVRAKGYAQPD